MDPSSATASMSALGRQAIEGCARIGFTSDATMKVRGVCAKYKGRVPMASLASSSRRSRMS
jgi:hypothetical protein